MKRHTERLICPDGQPLAATWHHPETAPKGGFLLASALGVPRTYYQVFADYLAEKGYLVLTFDYRGISESRYSSQHPQLAQMRSWGQLDMPTAFRALNQKLADKPLHFVGHSCGGQLLGLMPEAGQFKTATLVASGVPYWRSYGWRGLRMWLNWHVFLPLLSLGKLFPARKVGLSNNDIPSGIVREWARWGRDPNYLFGDQHDLPLEGYQALTLPMLCYGFADDNLAPPATVLDLSDRYTNTFQESRIVSGDKLAQTGGLGHNGFFRPDRGRPLWPEMLGWVEQYSPA
ncbi:alpha/beta hydrolase family protein [Ferrimonas marina]|uniref:Predicted alpha/beta hydrolase n=1 Tax=Ferrimonas marina TaxID=299255 RepID=A0A1M5Z5W0_9GAMM|nr:alpha/beta fold hydrolase [Ferrimonas marina]SHI19571.1 Predicted alpha/beta hydrolase [Ferrimonas marina]